MQVQWFERDRLEIQPDGAVTTGRLGVERLEQLGTPWQQGPGVSVLAGCEAFAETGHTVCAPFLAYWRANGGLSRFGFPVTPAMSADLEGNTYTVQYFERRRFELHPEIAPDSVLLGLLGREVLSARSGTPPPAPPAAPAPTPAPLPPAAPQPPAPSYNNCQADPNSGLAPNSPVKIVGINKSSEEVTLQNVSAEAVNLDGWIMCSIRGNQQHPIGGALAPGERKSFPGPAANIWNNSDKDDGALYNTQGQLISYWND